MPYRRLPNTDDARIRALQKAIQQTEIQDIQHPVVALETLRDANVLLRRLQTSQSTYKQSLRDQSGTNHKYQSLLKNARLYISHFIQVLNLSVIRAEIREEQKSYYGLNPIDYSIPDMTSEIALLGWGEKIINGEVERTQHGGAPIYNPTIAKVRVHYDLFKEAYYTQKIHQKNTFRALESISDLREPADKLISSIWNQVEEHFKDLGGEARLNQCRQYGVVYYYRKGEIAG